MTANSTDSNLGVSSPTELTAELLIPDGQRSDPACYAARLLLDQAGVQAQISVDRAVGTEEGLLLPCGVRVSLGQLLEVFSVVSLEREMATGRVDRHGRFDESVISWDYSDPWVSRLALELRRGLEDAGVVGSLRRRGLQVIITHDVDWVTPTEPASIVKSTVGKRIDGQPDEAPCGQRVGVSVWYHQPESWKNQVVPWISAMAQGQQDVSIVPT